MEPTLRIQRDIDKYTPEQRVRDEMLVRTSIINRTFGDRQRRTCYKETWPAHECATCRWMWTCKRQEENHGKD